MTFLITLINLLMLCGHFDHLRTYNYNPSALVAVLLSYNSTRYCNVMNTSVQVGAYEYRCDVETIENASYSSVTSVTVEGN